MTMQTNRIYEGPDASLDLVYDDTTFNQARQSYRITQVICINKTGNPSDPNSSPGRTITFWAVYKGSRITQSVAANSTFTYTPTGNRTTADVTEVGIS